MNTRFASCAAALAGVVLLAISGASQGATVGYFGFCSQGSPVPSITAAGHTPVAVASLDAASLAGLDGLLILSCTFSANADVSSAVANGLELIIHDWSPSGSTPAKLPGAPAITVTSSGGGQMDLAAGSPIASGPAGPLTNASLDGGTSSYHGSANLASLPAGSTPLTVVEGNPAAVVTFAYPYGTGRVVYGAMPLDHYLPGGAYDQANLCGSNPVCTGMRTYLTNLVAWAVPNFTSCADEGFSGSKLTLCRQVCEIEQTPTRLTSLIKLYMSAYRSEPPCAR